MLTGGVDQTFQRTDGAGTTGFLTDALGSTVALTNGSGAIGTSYTYEPFGKTTTSGTTSANSAQFTGRENDGALDYYRARYLQPTFGRFLSEDPLGFAAGDPHLYAYAGNNPTCQTDPSGRIPPLIVACASGAAINVALQIISDRLGGRKTTLGELGESAVIGCGIGLFPFARVLEATGFGTLTRAFEFGVWPYRTLRADIKGLGLEAHHLIEKRFADLFHQSIWDMAAVVVTHAEHTVFTKAWQREIPKGVGTLTATAGDVLAAAGRIYANYPELLKALGL
jgi:RHS repeat-associated protein